MSLHLVVILIYLKSAVHLRVHSLKQRTICIHTCNSFQITRVVEGSWNARRKTTQEEHANSNKAVRGLGAHTSLPKQDLLFKNTQTKKNLHHCFQQRGESLWVALKAVSGSSPRTVRTNKNRWKQVRGTTSSAGQNWIFFLLHSCCRLLLITWRATGHTAECWSCRFLTLLNSLSVFWPSITLLFLQTASSAS